MHENAIFSPRRGGGRVRRVRPMLDPPLHGRNIHVSREYSNCFACCISESETNNKESVTSTPHTTINTLISAISSPFNYLIASPSQGILLHGGYSEIPYVWKSQQFEENVLKTITLLIIIFIFIVERFRIKINN